MFICQQVMWGHATVYCWNPIYHRPTTAASNSQNTTTQKRVFSSILSQVANVLKSITISVVHVFLSTESLCSVRFAIKPWLRKVCPFFVVCWRRHHHPPRAPLPGLAGQSLSTSQIKKTFPYFQSVVLNPQTRQRKLLRKIIWKRKYIKSKVV